MSGCRSRPAKHRNTDASAFARSDAIRLSGAIESSAATIEDVVAEVRSARMSERQGRLIDGDDTASMEKKKRDGYF